MAQCYNIILFNELNKAITIKHSVNGGNDINIKIPKRKADGTPSNYTLSGAIPVNTYTFAMVNLVAEIYNPWGTVFDWSYPELGVTTGYLAIGTTLVTTHMDVWHGGDKILQCNDATAFPQQCISSWDQTPSAYKSVTRLLTNGDTFEVWFFA